MACWLQAVVDGRASIDDALEAIVGTDTAHHVAELTDDLEPLALALGRLRGLAWSHVALPAPGDPLGLAGPAAFNLDALDAGEAVVLGGTGHGLVPHLTGAGVVWQVHPAADPPPYDLAEASRALRCTLSVTADALADLDVAHWSPEAAEALLDLRKPLRLDLPPGTPGDVAGVLSTALRCRAIVYVALDGDGGAVTAHEADRRRAALRPLVTAVRLAVCAATSTPRQG